MRPDAPWKKKPLKVQCTLMRPRIYDHLWLAIAGKRVFIWYHLRLYSIFSDFFFWSALEANFAVCRMDGGTFSWDEVFAGFTVEEVAQRQEDQRRRMVEQIFRKLEWRRGRISGFWTSSNADNSDIEDFASEGDDKRRNTVGKRGNGGWIIIKLYEINVEDFRFSTAPW